MNLKEIFVMEDNNTPEQKYYEVCFMFEDEKGLSYAYNISFDQGMHLDIFKEFMNVVSTKMQTDGPYQCEVDDEAHKNLN